MISVMERKGGVGGMSFLTYFNLILWMRRLILLEDCRFQKKDHHSLVLNRFENLQISIYS
jgi:hypothetical protein